jgi:hypothetical protein
MANITMPPKHRNSSIIRSYNFSGAGDGDWCSRHLKLHSVRLHDRRPFYQQVYSAASFSTPININEITFYNSFTSGGFKMTGTFDVYFSLTSTPIATFDTGAFAFPDSSFTHVFNGVLPAVSGG